MVTAFDELLAADSALGSLDAALAVEARALEDGSSVAASLDASGSLDAPFVGVEFETSAYVAALRH